MTRHLIRSTMLWAGLAAWAGGPLRAEKLDFRKPPGAEERKTRIDAGWQASRDALRAALLESYSPAAPDSPAFADWLALQDWFDVFSRDQQEALAQVVRLHLWSTPGEERPTILLPGQNQPAAEGAQNVSLEQALAITRGSKFQSEFLPAFVPAGYAIGSGTIGDALGREAVEALAGDPALGRELFQNAVDEDIMPVALRLIEDFRKAAGPRWDAYRRFAVAMALVYDEPPPAYWPHHQVGQDRVLHQKTTPVERFQFWIQNNEDRKLLLDLRKLTVEQAKFVADALVPDEELLWAQKNVKAGRTSFDKAFFMIRYDHARAKTAKYDWMAPDYRLETIQKEGGICVDQAYFAMLAGKANGLPTLFFTGQGASGGHGWFGYMKSDDKWELNCGRYSGQNFSVGVALDPQTWSPISDHELAYLAARFRDKPEYQKSELHLRMARLYGAAGQAAQQLSAVESALRLCPQNVRAWDAKTAAILASADAPKLLKAHAEAAIRQFSANDDIKVRYQKVLAGVARLGGDAAAANSIERKIITQQKEERADLTLDTAASRLKEFTDAKQYEEGYKEFRKLIKKLGETGGGNAFQGVVEPFVQSLIAAGQAKLAEKSLEVARQELRPPPESLIEEAFAALEEKAGVKKKKR